MHEQELDLVSSYNYLGTIIEEPGKIDKEISDKILRAERLLKSLRNTFLEMKERNKNTSIYQKVVRRTIIYGSES